MLTFQKIYALELFIRPFFKKSFIHSFHLYFDYSLICCYGYPQQDGNALLVHEGSFSRSDYYGDHDLVNIHFIEPLKLEPQVIYTLRVDLVDSTSFTFGIDGEMNLSGPGGIIFSLHSTGLPESDPTVGPVAKFIYSRYVDHVIGHMTFVQC